MQTESDLFKLLAQWSDLLFGVDNKGPEATTKLNKLAEEIKQLCAQTENDLHPQPSLVQVKKEPVATDFKPSFVFQLNTDDLINPNLPTFDCVYDFCEKLAEFCENSTAKQLNIETDWRKLLLACSSNNYDRFMWIHLTFQSSNNVNLDWNQARRRLMTKFDLPTRRKHVMNLITHFRFVPELETIESANKKFKRLSEEAQINTVTAYTNILPPGIKDVVISTITYDALTDFPCDLNDIMQRATVFATATDDDFIFYSKTAHLAVRLDHQKVNQKDCEFHLLAEHSTSTCPDYDIVKYPYMDFTPLSISNIPSKNNSSPPPVAPAVAPQTNTTDSSFQPSIPTTPASQAVGDNQLATAAEAPIKNEPTPASNAVMMGHDNQPVTQGLPNQPIVMHDLTNETATTLQESITQPIQELVRQTISEVVQQPQQLPNQTQEDVYNFQNMNSSQLVALICDNSEAGKPIPPSILGHLEQKLNDEVMAAIGKPPVTAIKRNSPSSTSFSSPLTRDRREESSYSNRRRSRSPERTYRREKSESLEQGCVIHGKSASHNTKECRQAQMVIPPRQSRGSRNNEPLTPPPPVQSATNNKKSRSRRHKDSSHCIFCGLLFKPGHLGVCREVKSRPNMRK